MSSDSDPIRDFVLTGYSNIVRSISLLPLVQPTIIFVIEDAVDHEKETSTFLTVDKHSRLYWIERGSKVLSVRYSTPSRSSDGRQALVSNAFCVRLEKNNQIMSPALAALQWLVPQCFSGQVAYKGSCIMLEGGLRIQEIIFGIAHSSTVAMMNDLGITCCIIQRYDQLLDHARYIEQKVLYVDHMATADACINLGLTYFALGKCDRAVSYFQTARSIKERHPGSEKPTLADTYGFLGEAYFKMSRFKLAIEWCRRSLEISETTSIKVMESLARSYTSLGIYGPAMEIYNHLLAIKPQLSLIHPLHHADIIHNMGITLQGMGKLHHAVEAFKTALQLYESSAYSCGDVVRVANAFKNLGSVYSQQGKNTKAIEYFQRALTIERSLGQKDLATANTLNSLGVAYGRQGFADLAMSHYKDALVIVGTLCGYEDHVDVADLFYNIGVTSFSLGYLRSAKHYLKQSICIFVPHLGDLHPKSRRAEKFLKALEHRLEIKPKNIRGRSHRHGRRRFRKG
jgi:tetratricopeptide (TPR) repeat protein